MKRLENKACLVTGAAMGLGLSVATAFAENGAKVALLDLDAAKGEAAAEELRRQGAEAIFVWADVTKASELEAAVSQTVGHFGGLDVLFANAAVQLHGQDAPAHLLPEEVWDKTITVNLKGIWLACKYGIRAMLEDKSTGGKSVILAGSPTGLTGAPNYTAYSASKGGVIALTRTIAADYGAHGIRVNALVPGPMETPLTSSLFADPEFRQAIVQATILKRLGQAHEVNGLAVFLASDEATYCTGGIYMADGGITAL